VDLNEPKQEVDTKLGLSLACEYRELVKPKNAFAKGYSKCYHRAHPYNKAPTPVCHPKMCPLSKPEEENV